MTSGSSWCCRLHATSLKSLANERLRRQMLTRPADRAPCVAVTKTASVLCLPARDEADEIAGLMLVQLLCQRGVAARVLSAVTLSGEMLEQVDADSTSVVCVSALPPFAAIHLRYLCKRLRPRFPHLRIVVGIWQTAGVGEKTQERLKVIGIDAMATTLVIESKSFNACPRTRYLLWPASRRANLSYRLVGTSDGRLTVEWESRPSEDTLSANQYLAASGPMVVGDASKLVCVGSSAVSGSATFVERMPAAIKSHSSPAASDA